MEHRTQKTDWKFILTIIGILCAIIAPMITVGEYKQKVLDLERKAEAHEVVKGVAYSARTTAEANTSSINDLKSDVQSIKATQETFRKEYREDQKEVQKTLQQVLIEVRK